MILDWSWFSPTRMAGVAAYTASLLACVLRWVSGGRSLRSGRPFGSVAGVQFLLLLDIVFDWRWRIHEFEDRQASRIGMYQLRRMPQAIVSVVLLLGLALFAIWIMRRFRNSIGAALTMTGTLLSVGLWTCEVISFHNTDKILYHLFGPLMAIALIWLGLAALTCYGVWMDGRGLLL